MTIDPDENGPENRAGPGVLWGDSPALRNAVIVLMGLLLGVILYGAGMAVMVIGKRASARWGSLTKIAEKFTETAEEAPQRVEIDPVPADLTALPPARPQGDPATWFSTDDYPTAALRHGTQGTVAFGVEVDRSGNLTRCFIVKSSGSPVLDSATCAIMRERARFAPAIDSAGQPVRSRYLSRVRWQSPE
ncbi:MAG: energy transducer TonB [Sphingomonas sp.]|uniref:energy transducer TonB n=1 Tax=Sphingomonas sp. TaxID=28214 RepID=UPI001AFDF1DF|nr:energy transducer TonB [Sphingomonas sp.]MBO9623429.1 energy transducer TonB [Sphingomonas sp.]